MRLLQGRYLRQLPQSKLPAGWNELPAVKGGNVWAVDATSYSSRPGPRVVDGVEILSRILNPKVMGPPTEADAIRIPLELMMETVAA
jgi:iron complex transport system substrate-binding protein